MLATSVACATRCPIAAAIDSHTGLNRRAPASAARAFSAVRGADSSLRRDPDGEHEQKEGHFEAAVKSKSEVVKTRPLWASEVGHLSVTIAPFIETARDVSVSEREKLPRA